MYAYIGRDLKGFWEGEEKVRKLNPSQTQNLSYAIFWQRRTIIKYRFEWPQADLKNDI